MRRRYLFSRAIYRTTIAGRQTELESLANGVTEACRDFVALPAESPEAAG